MSLVTLRSLLEAYIPLDDADSKTQQRFKAFVSDEPYCFERSLAYGHLTASCWLLNSAHNKVLLTHHRKLDIWVQLGGHADSNSDLLEVALQEAQEESGIAGIEPIRHAIFDLDIHRIPARNEIAEHLHYDVRFALQTTTSDAYSVSSESHDLAWVPVGEIESFTQEWSVVRMKRKWEQEVLQTLRQFRSRLARTTREAN